MTLSPKTHFGASQSEPFLQYVAFLGNHEPPEYPPSQTGKPMLALGSCNTLMICEQKTSKAPESQSRSSLSWQSTVVVTETGAVRGAPPGTSKPELRAAALQREVQGNRAPMRTVFFTRIPLVIMHL